MPESKLLTADQVAAGVAYAYSDTLVLQPFARDDSAAKVGAVAVQSATAGVVNAAGNVPTVLALEKNESTGSMLTSEEKEGEALTVLTGSPFLKQMLPQMYQIAGNDAAHVVHVATHEKYNSSLADIALVRETGIPILSAASAQEAHDCAVIAHLCKWSWFHCNCKSCSFGHVVGG